MYTIIILIDRCKFKTHNLDNGYILLAVYSPISDRVVMNINIIIGVGTRGGGGGELAPPISQVWGGGGRIMFSPPHLGNSAT